MGGNKQALSLKGKNERQQERRRIGKLADNMVLPSTVQRYCKAVMNFLTWLCVAADGFPKEMWDLDPALSDYIEHLWEEGDGVSFANDTLAGVLHYRPRSKHYIPMSRKLLKTWNKKEFPARAPPFSVPLTMILVDEMRMSGEGGMALGCLRMFFLILRTGEMIAIARGDIQFSPDGSPFILNLGLTKVGVRGGNSESVVCELP